MQNFDYVTPTRLIFGEGVISELPAVMKPFGKRVLLTYGGGSIKRMGLYDKVKELLADDEKLKAMSVAMTSLAAEDATERICSIILDTIHKE